jgi:hypothetical protein
MTDDTPRLRSVPRYQEPLWVPDFAGAETMGAPPALMTVLKRLFLGGLTITIAAVVVLAVLHWRGPP